MKDIKDYLHLYLGCECIVDGIKTKLSAYHIEFQDDDTIKPILRPLLDMDGNEQIEYAKLTKLVTDGVHSVQIRIDTPESFLWKLSKGFDLFGLIEDGLVIDKSKQAK